MDFYSSLAPFNRRSKRLFISRFTTIFRQELLKVLIIFPLFNSSLLTHRSAFRIRLGLFMFPNIVRFRPFHIFPSDRSTLGTPYSRPPCDKVDASLATMNYMRRKDVRETGYGYGYARCSCCWFFIIIHMPSYYLNVMLKLLPIEELHTRMWMLLIWMWAISCNAITTCCLF